ncbi:hypothetical protein BpHYR1_023269 [Brachionus plicatilis]|uniref:RNA transcription, translation and transport factor protein n=1 Tax=Brachionus plicatilis TaxID=10195 RepID=A0A3M7Q4I9_BRAPC|nr:hypothetical protein BpHYR1_023269 [Brachionus plicatilis]
MFERKLTALDYHSPDNFDYQNEKTFRNFISWIENQKIRLYPIEERVSLDNVESDDWNQVYEKYLKEMDMENLNSNLPREEQIEIILSHAIRLEFTDNVDKINTFRASQDELMKQNSETNPLENIDYNSVDFVDGLNRMQRLLNVPTKSGDNLTVLQAISKLVSEKLNPKAVQASLEEHKYLKEPTQLTLNSINGGIDCKDPILNDAVKVLRLLHIKELRDLQTKINETIVSIQTITANPKTDSSLGKVGF